MTTTTMLGKLVTEHWTGDEPLAGMEAPPQRMDRPYGTPLRNDGTWHHWMAPGHTYQLAYDGTGWRVTCTSWPDGHAYRLARPDGRYTNQVPLAGTGWYVLDPQHRYRLAETQPYVWTLTVTD